MLYKKESLNITEVDKNKGGIGISKTTHEGHEHSLTNIGDKTFKWMALILYV